MWSSPHRHDDLGDDREVGGVPSGGREALANRHRHFVQEALRPERHHQQAVGDFGCGPGHLGTERAEVDRRRSERVRPGVERRRHQRVPEELAAEVEPLTVVPGGEDRPQSADHLLDPCDRAVELSPVTLLDLRANLGAEAEDETALGDLLKVVGLMGQLYRVARERNRDVGHQVQSPERRRECQRGEDVPRTLEGEHSGGPGFSSSADRSIASVAPNSAVMTFTRETLVRIRGGNPR